VNNPTSATSLGNTLTQAQIQKHHYKRAQADASYLLPGSSSETLQKKKTQPPKQGVVENVKHPQMKNLPISNGSSYRACKPGKRMLLTSNSFVLCSGSC